MLLNIQSLSPLGAGGTTSQDSLDFAEQLDLSHLRMWGEHPFHKPVCVTGRVFARAGALVLEYDAQYALSTSCSRCLEPVSAKRKVSFSHLLAEAKDGEDELADHYLPVEGGYLDLAAVVAGDLLLTMDHVVLCSPGCKGLCPKCGTNLNRVSCGCALKEPDPRFDALRKLLES